MATFGETNILGGDIYTGRQLACQYQMNSEDGTLTSVSVYINNVQYATKINCAIYADDAGLPGALIAQGVEQDIVQGWNEVPVSAPLTADTLYWLAFGVDANTHVAADSAATNQTEMGDLGTNFPDPYYKFAKMQNVLAIYGTYTPSSGGTSVLISDSGQGGENIGIGVQFGLADTGTGADALNESTQLAMTESGSGSDFITALTAALQLNESGSGNDALSAIIASLNLTENATGVDMIAQLTARLMVSDTATSSDILNIIKEGIKTIQDAGTGVDAIAVTNRFSLQDTGSGADILSHIAAALVLDEGGLGSDQIYLSILKKVQDSGLGADQVSAIVAQLAIPEIAQGLDAIGSVLNRLTVSDSAAGNDALIVYGKILQVTARYVFEAAKRKRFESREITKMFEKIIRKKFDA